MPNSAASGTTRLFGLAGQVAGNSVSLFATNYPVGDTDPSFLCGITDQLSATAPAVGEAFSTLYTAVSDTKVRTVTFAPTLAPAPAVTDPATWAMMIGGFGLVGGAMRRRKAVASAQAASRIRREPLRPAPEKCCHHHFPEKQDGKRRIGW